MADLREEERARVARPPGASRRTGASWSLAENKEPHLGDGRLPDHRLPGHVLLRRAEGEQGAREPRRGRPRAAAHVREARDPAAGAEAACGRRGGRRLRQRGGDHLQEGARETRHHFSVFRGGAEPPRAFVRRWLGSVVPHRHLRHAELGRLQRRLVRVRAEGRALPDGALDLLPHQRPGDRPVRAHADRGRAGSLYELGLEGLHLCPSATKTSFHAAVVEPVALDDAEIKYSTVQNCTPATRRGRAASTTS